jgi:hypothetical protein
MTSKNEGPMTKRNVHGLMNRMKGWWTDDQEERMTDRRLGGKRFGQTIRRKRTRKNDQVEV